MTPTSPLENRLFRLCIILKLVFWTVLGAILLKAIWATATGQALPDPVTLMAIVATLGVLQLCALLAWWRVRRARQRRDVA